jgi:gamma-glutamyltranspeptidase / glutathione hydrolase
VIEPCSTGIGGDAFALYFDASSKKVSCLMGNGSSAGQLSLDLLKSRGIGIGSGLSPLDPRSGLCVTVPGAAALWEDLVTNHGNQLLSDVLQPAINLARDGFVLGPITAAQWAQGFIQGDEAHRIYRPGQIVFCPPAPLS